MAITQSFSILFHSSYPLPLGSSDRRELRDPLDCISFCSLNSPLVALPHLSSSIGVAGHACDNFGRASKVSVDSSGSTPSIAFCSTSSGFASQLLSINPVIAVPSPASLSAPRSNPTKPVSRPKRKISLNTPTFPALFLRSTYLPQCRPPSPSSSPRSASPLLPSSILCGNLLNRHNRPGFLSPACTSLSCLLAA